MDVCQSSAAFVALDVRARTAIPGEALMKLIAAVFGIAAVLIVVWAVLWMRGIGKRS